MARTGAYFASEHFGLVPDLVLSAKGIAGGLPLAGVTGRAEIMDASQPGGLGGTFGGNPVSCAAAIAVFEQIESRRPAGRGRSHRGDPATRCSTSCKAKYPIIAEVRGIGAMLAIELLDPETHEPRPDAVNAVAAAAAQQGVLVLTAGTYGNVLRFLPSLALSDELIRDAFGVLDEAFATL